MEIFLFALADIFDQSLQRLGMPADLRIRTTADAIAAAVVGGVSAAGGVGKVMGSLIGALVMTSLTSGMNLMGIDISYQYIVRAIVLAAAVIFDVATRKTSQ